MTRSTTRIHPDIKRKILERITKALLSDGNGRYRYTNSVSDETIAQAFGIATWTVQNIRKDFYGHLSGDTVTGSSPLAHAFRKISELENAFVELDWRVKALEERLGPKP